MRLPVLIVECVKKEKNVNERRRHIAKTANCKGTTTCSWDEDIFEQQADFNNISTLEFQTLIIREYSKGRGNNIIFESC